MWDNEKELVQISSAVKAAIMTGKKDEKEFMNFLTLSICV
jgi:hypothetical protein